MSAEGANKRPHTEMDNFEDVSKKSKLEQENVGGQTENIPAHPALLQTAENEKNERERSRLLNIFSADIWCLIFEKMTNPDDQENFLNSSLFWRNLLYSKRKQFLFKKVWPFLAPNYKKQPCFEDYWRDFLKNCEYPSPDRDSMRCTSCNRIRVPGWFSEILKLRLVCKKWSEAIDDFYQCHTESWQDTVDGKSGIDVIGDWICCEFSARFRDNFVKSFNLHFDKTHGGGERSPFIGKSIEISLGHLPSPLDDQVFQDEILDMLIKYGSHIQRCRIKDDDRFEVENYRRLKQLLEKMPNLIYLDLIFRQSWPCPTSSDLAQVADFINLNPLPKLEHLQVLSVKGLYAHTFNELTRNNNHITKLRFEDYCSEMYNDYTCSLFKLKELYVIVENARELNFLVYPQFNWSLTQLTIRFNEMKDFDLLQVFTLISSVRGETLTDLVIISPFAMQFHKEHHAHHSHCFENISKLEVASQEPFALDLLSLMMDSLKDLNLFLLKGQPQEIMNVQTKISKAIQLLSVSGRPLEQPVLPNLKRFQYFESVLHSVTPRKMWDRCRWEWNKVVMGNNQQS